MADLHLDKGKTNGRTRLIEAARTLAEEKCFDDIIIDEIVKKADLSRPAFYYHFAGGKEELREELVRGGLLPDTPAQDTVQAIMNAALRVFARSGISAATLDDIAAEAGVSRGALSWHFHSKESLLAAIIKHFSPHNTIQPIMEQLQKDMQNETLDDEAILRRIAGAFYDAYSAQADSEMVRLAVLLINTHPEFARIIAEKIAEKRKKILNYVRNAQDEGRFRKDIDAGLFAQILTMSFFMRAIGQGLSDLLPFAHLSREETIEQFVSLLLYGIAGRDAHSALCDSSSKV